MAASRNSSPEVNQVTGALWYPSALQHTASQYVKEVPPREYFLHILSN